MIETVMQSNPELRRMMDAHPELRQALSDPELIQQSLRAASNPNLRQEMTRNTDRAMANIETMPGGYNALAHMYQTIQSPLMDAARTPVADTTAESGGPSPGELTNPWATPLPSGGDGPDRVFGGGPMHGATGPFGVGPGMQNIEQLQGLMQNPAVQQLTQQMMANPAMMQQMMASNPMLQQLAASNPQISQMLSNPEMMRQMADPGTDAPLNTCG